jgi:hypothetical protein
MRAFDTDVLTQILRGNPQFTERAALPHVEADGTSRLEDNKTSSRTRREDAAFPRTTFGSTESSEHYGSVISFYHLDFRVNQQNRVFDGLLPELPLIHAPAPCNNDRDRLRVKRTG